MNDTDEEDRRDRAAAAEIATEILAPLYIVTADERQPFGERWSGPKKFQPWLKTLIATYEKRLDSDGQTVEVYGLAAPARFYELQVLAGEDSCHRPLDPWNLATGSGMAQLAANLAQAISEGMLSLR